MHSHANLTLLLLALLIHEAGRAYAGAPSEAGHPGAFVEFADLPAPARQGYLTTAANLLAVVEPWCAATGSKPLADAIEWLADHINTADRASIDNGWTLSTGGWAPFADLSSDAQAFRRAQATYLLARFGFKNTTTAAA